jgi:hypothetical protein
MDTKHTNLADLLVRQQRGALARKLLLLPPPSLGEVVVRVVQVDEVAAALAAEHARRHVLVQLVDLLLVLLPLFVSATISACTSLEAR